jgi:hypothetical protein
MDAMRMNGDDVDSMQEQAERLRRRTEELQAEHQRLIGEAA